MSSAHNRYPAIYVVFVSREAKWQCAFKTYKRPRKITKLLITLFYTEHIKATKVAVKNCNGKCKNFYYLPSFLFVNWQITVQQKRLIYFSLDFWIVPYSRAQKLETVHVFP